MIIMNKVWSDQAWEDYLYWQTQDKRTAKRINQLIKEIDRDPFGGIGKPEPLKHDLSGYWSRRIDEVHRLVYRVAGKEGILIASCRFHYGKEL